MKKNKKSAFSKNKKTTNNNSKSFFEKIKNYYYKIEESVKKNPKKQFIYFVLGFVLVYLILTEIVYAFPKGFFENFVGEQVNFLLNLSGIKTIVTNGQVFEMFLPESEKTIIISWLCSGVLEIIILISTMIVTFGVRAREKIIGIISALILGHFFNLLRIMITIQIIITQNAQTFELAHDLLFRATLFLYIVIVYTLWFGWGIKKTSEEKIEKIKK
ncbi:MAG: exosortase/archaeosortase family protein [Candidatus Diapherotrites archaeon]|jgi:exosortase/archaeosortase family protein|uniref:Exosortase/archaeosortase family protein n=1 Tax=Candidatus Iainarchaeum sp. TaxID=3101447 RepID=A0A7K4C080_9ARCH|nr:exosortase/archaeosortase family protein [Candidatus Diapherotrites archaeon]